MKFVIYAPHWIPRKVVGVNVGHAKCRTVIPEPRVCLQILVCGLVQATKALVKIRERSWFQLNVNKKVIITNNNVVTISRKCIAGLPILVENKLNILLVNILLRHSESTILHLARYMINVTQRKPLCIKFFLEKQIKLVMRTRNF